MSSDFSLYIQALTHTSWVQENGGCDNERLEFIGDAVLQLFASEVLYARFPDADEGTLSRMRRAIVNNRFLAARAAELGLGELLRLGRGEASSGGRARRRNLAGALEALLGAIYLDQGPTAAQQTVHGLLMPHLEGMTGRKEDKQRLHEWVQATYKNVPRYVTLGATGPDHDRRFTMAVVINGEQVASGEGRSKREATQIAASRALDALGLASL